MDMVVAIAEVVKLQSSKILTKVLEVIAKDMHRGAVTAESRKGSRKVFN
jgi:hypothetical protein